MCSPLPLPRCRGGSVKAKKHSREGGVGGPRGNALIDIDTSLAFTSGLFISTWLLEFVLVCRCFSWLYIFNGGIFVVIIGFYCKLTSQPRPLAPQSNNFAPVPFLSAVVVFALVIYTHFITTFPMSSVRVVRQVRVLHSPLCPATPTGRATSLSLFGGKTYSATSAAFISFPLLSLC